MTSMSELTRGRAATGDHQHDRARGAKYATPNSIPLPSGSIARIEPALERGRISQALLDVCALLFISFFIISGALSVPLALFLLLFAKF